MSPLTTSFAETSVQLCRVIGNPFSFSMFKMAALRFWTRVKVRCGEGCSSGGPGLEEEMMNRSGSTTATCRRHMHDVYAFDRTLQARGSRESHSSDRSSEFDSSQLLHRRQRAAAAAAAASGQSLTSFPRKTSSTNRRHDSSVSFTLVNLSAFRPSTDHQLQSTGLDIEMGSLSVSYTKSSAAASAAQSLVVPQTTVTITTIDPNLGLVDKGEPV